MSVVFITGGARRIGGRLAERFAADGWAVGVMYNASGTQKDELAARFKKDGVTAAFSRCNVAKELELEASLNELTSALGTPDVIVSNAGIFPDAKHVVHTSLADVVHAISVNTLPLLTIARWMETQRSTKPQSKNTSDVHVQRLVAITSLGAVELWKDRLAYNVSKSALQTMAYSLSRSLAPHISVNSVAPGAIVIEDEPSSSDDAVTVPTRIPMERYGTADDVYDAVHYFATCSSYITGQLIMVDGGYHRVR